MSNVFLKTLINRQLTLFGNRISNIEALEEMRRDTKPYCILALIWNSEDCKY